VSATGAPEAKVTPAVFPKYQLLNLPDCAVAVEFHRKANAKNSMPEKHMLRLEKILWVKFDILKTPRSFGSVYGNATFRVGKIPFGMHYVITTYISIKPMITN
jgi:hypothetical protein